MAGPVGSTQTPIKDVDQLDFSVSMSMALLRIAFLRVKRIGVGNVWSWLKRGLSFVVQSNFDRDVNMKSRRHHNNKGLRQIKRGKTREQVAKMAERLLRPYSEGCRQYMEEMRKGIAKQHD